MDPKELQSVAWTCLWIKFFGLQGHLYVTGLGDSGQLGLGMERHQKIALVFTLIPFPYEDYNIVSVTAGIAHNSKPCSTQTPGVPSKPLTYTLVCWSVTQYCWLSVAKSSPLALDQWGSLAMEAQRTSFKYILHAYNTLASNVLQYVIICYNQCFCLPQPTLVSVLRDKKIVFATAGVCHSIFLDSSGNAYTCGKGQGLLGHGDTRIRTVPTWVESLQVGFANPLTLWGVLLLCWWCKWCRVFMWWEQQPGWPDPSSPARMG